HELKERVRAAADVAPDVVLVVAMDLGRAHHRARENPVAESRREALDLRLHSFGHVECGPVRNVAVRPHGVLARGSARRVEEALLSDEDERALGRRAARDLGLALGDLVERSSEMDRPCAKALFGAPRDRAIDRVVELEDARAVAERMELRAIPVGWTRAGDVFELPRGHVAEIRSGRADLVQ